MTFRFGKRRMGTPQGGPAVRHAFEAAYPDRPSLSQWSGDRAAGVAADRLCQSGASPSAASNPRVFRSKPPASSTAALRPEYGPRRFRSCRSSAGVSGLLACKSWVGSGSVRSEEHTSELQSLMRISYAVFCLKKKTARTEKQNNKYRVTN